jgi:hypothetical protein
MQITGDKIRARCFASNAVKVFMIDKIEILDHAPTNGKDSWDPQAKLVEKYSSIQDIHAAHATKFESMGWHVVHETGLLALHRKWKSGKPLKGADVSLSYSEWVYDEYMDYNDDGDLVEFKTNKRKSARPYGVWAKKHHGSSFGHLDRAAERFLQWAAEAAPNQ